MAKGKKGKNASQFTLDSTRFCDICSKEVKIGLGGEHNWTQHLRGDAHRLTAEGIISRQKSAISKFFVKAPPRTPGALRVPSLQLDAPAVTGTSTPSSETGRPRAEEVIDIDALDSPSHRASRVSPSLGLIPWLREAASRLPTSVPLGTQADTLARFSGHPQLEIIDEDPWEYVDQALNAVIGYGATVADINGLLRRGLHGLDALCNWMESCILDLKIDAALFEGKIQRVLDAIGEL